MAYIGNVPAEKYIALTQQTFSTPTGTSFTLSQAVTNSVDIDLYIDNVKQDPASYSVSGTALTTSTIASPSTMYCIFNGKAMQTVNPPDDSVGLSQLASGTDGNVITFDASGNPAYVATGSSGQVLTSAGAGAPPTFSAAPAHTGNVAFPATQSASGDANTLDDYEEGTWTPVYAQGTNLGTTSGAGKYTKIGDLVYCTFQATCSNLNSMSGSCKINGIPFTSANNGTYPAGAIGYMSSLDTSAGYSIHFFMNPNTAFLELYLNDVSTGTSGLQASELSTGGQMFGSISFKV